MWSQTTSVGSLGEYVIATSTVEPDNTGTILPEGDDLGIYLFVDNAAHRTSLQYRINYVRISNNALDFAPSTEVASFAFSLDDDETVFAGELEAGFVAGNNATQSLNQFADLVQVMWPTVTHGAVTDYSITHAVGEYTSTTTAGRDTDSVFNSANAWDIREGSGITSSSRSFVSNDFWATFEGGWLHFSADNTFAAPEGSTGTIVITDADDDTSFGSFTWDEIVVEVATSSISLQSLHLNSIISGESFLGNIGTVTNISIVFNDDGVQVPGKQIQLDTNQTGDISQTLTFTRGNSAGGGVLENTEFVQGIPGSGASNMHSSYTLTDPAGTEVTSMTARSQESLESVLNRIHTAANAHTFMDTNGFEANQSDDTLWLKPNDRVLESRDWSISVEHGSGNDGDIAFTHSRPNNDVPTSGEMSFPDDIYNTENGEIE